MPRALESGALRGRTIVSLTCEEVVPPQFTDNLVRHGYHAVAHFQVPAEESSADEAIDNVISICRTSNIEEVVVFVDAERMSNVRWLARRLRVLPLPVTLVPFGSLAQLFQRSHADIGDTVGIELQRARCRQASRPSSAQSNRVFVYPPDRAIAHPARLRDCDPARFVRARPFPPDPAWF